MAWWFQRTPAPPTITDANGHLRIFDYAQHLGGKSTKHALLSYLPHAVAAGVRGEPTVRFSNEGIAREWPRVLNELGYSVDIVGWDDKTFVPTRNYDLIILHGARTFANIYQPLSQKPPLIHFLTGTYWRFNNKEEEARLASFAERHGVTVPKDRYIAVNEDPVNEAAKGIIILGNQRIRQTFDKYPTVEVINNASYPDDHFIKTTKDYGEAR
ncbi:MAG TPA: hypothetical protein VLA88_05640, partial [Candidatus Saccharimonadales bacterium]|nr:hypothetical protein [Candidatus Saccharimonadales bacterium]